MWRGMGVGWSVPKDLLTKIYFRPSHVQSFGRENKKRKRSSVKVEVFSITGGITFLL